MKKYFWMLLMVAAGFFVACGTAENKKDVQEHPGKTVPAELTSLEGASFYYECPMKCDGKKFAGPGICPVCEMDLVRVEVVSEPVKNNPADSAKAQS